MQRLTPQPGRASDPEIRGHAREIAALWGTTAKSLLASAEGGMEDALAKEPGWASLPGPGEGSLIAQAAAFAMGAAWLWTFAGECGGPEHRAALLIRDECVKRLGGAAPDTADELDAARVMASAASAAGALRVLSAELEALFVPSWPR